jgi:hypothetical protein
MISYVPRGQLDVTGDLDDLDDLNDLDDLVDGSGLDGVLCDAY